jgi:hypothetical protein
MRKFDVLCPQDLTRVPTVQGLTFPALERRKFGRVPSSRDGWVGLSILGLYRGSQSSWSSIGFSSSRFLLVGKAVPIDANCRTPPKRRRDESPVQLSLCAFNSPPGHQAAPQKADSGFRPLALVPPR